MRTPEKQTISILEAAIFLNISRTFLLKEIEAVSLPHIMVGAHCRIQFSDLVSYVSSMHAKQQKALDEMAENAHELGLEY